MQVRNTKSTSSYSQAYTSNIKIPTSDIKYILLDMGGVFFSFDWFVFSEELAKRSTLDTASSNQIHEYIHQNLKYEYETGQINTQSFYKALKSKFKLRISEQEFSELLSKCSEYSSALQVIPSLAKIAKLIIASNTNEVHANYILSNEIIKEHTHATAFSHEIKHYKPHPDYFLHILKKYDVKPSEVIFIDDSIENIEGSLSVGIPSLLYQSPDNLKSLVRKIS